MTKQTFVLIMFTAFFGSILLTQPAHSYAITRHHEVLMSATKTGNGAAATAMSIYQSDTIT